MSYENCLNFDFDYHRKFHEAASTEFFKQRQLYSLVSDVIFIFADQNVLNCTLEGHTNAIWGLSVHSSKLQLLSCSADGTVRLWSPGQKPPLLQSYTAEEGMWPKFHEELFKFIRTSIKMPHHMACQIKYCIPLYEKVTIQIKNLCLCTVILWIENGAQSVSYKSCF